MPIWASVSTTSLVHPNQLGGTQLLVGLQFGPRSQYGLKHLPRIGLEDGVAPAVGSGETPFSGLPESEHNLEPHEVPPSSMPEPQEVFGAPPFWRSWQVPQGGLVGSL